MALMMATGMATLRHFPRSWTADVTDTKYLRQRKNVWFFQYRLPAVLAKHYGKKMYTVSLETSDLKIARQKRGLLLTRLAAEADSIQGKSPSSFQRQELLRIARAYAADDKALEDQDPELSLADTLDPERLTPLEKDALRYVGGYEKEVLRRYTVTLKEAFEEWTSGVDHKPTTLSKHRRAVELFLAFLGVPDVALSSVKKIDVREFIKTQRDVGMAGQTIQNYISGLSGAYRYAGEFLDESLSSNPFQGHRLNAKKDVRSFDMFTPLEVSLLLKATEGREDDLHLLILMGVYTGARLSELIDLKITDLRNVDGVPCLHVEEGKNRNATRRIPLHSALRESVLQQVERASLAGSARLFPKADGVKRSDGKPSAYFSQRFSRLRSSMLPSEHRKLGFHSFRVMFITALGRARIPEAEAVWVTGHERGMTTAYRVYNRGPSTARLQEVVESFDLSLLETPQEQVG